MDRSFEQQLGFYPYGVQYHRAPTPLPEEWAGDLKEIRRVGYTHIQLRPQWRWHERERGRYVWDDLGRLFDLAAENRLRVILKPMVETAPDWVFAQLQGSRIGVHGVPISPIAHSAYYVGGWWPCFDNPHVAQAAAAFIEALVGQFHRHPALWFYDAWNEPVSRPVAQCHCPHSVEAYRAWLKGRFETIDQLNAHLGKAWSGYDSLLPPAAYEDYAELFLWRQWAAHSVANQVRLAAQAIRRADPKAFVLVHAGGSSVVQDPVCATNDDLLTAASADRYGTSFPISLRPIAPLDHAQPDYQCDWMRRVDPLYWCHEFYPNHGNWARPPEPLTLRRLVWQAIAGGAAGFTYWQYRRERFGTESDGYGLRNIDGSATPGSDVADEIGQTLRRVGHRLAGTRRPRSPVALTYIRHCDLISRITECKCSGINGGLANEGGSVDYAYKMALKGAHALHWTAGWDTDFVIPGDELAGYRLLHVTAAEMIDATCADWLKRYVHGGGRLLVEFPFACRDERTWVHPTRPAHGLEELLGCGERQRIVCNGVDPEIAVFSGGQRITAQRWRVDLAMRGAKPLAHWADGSVAAARHQVGKGMVLTLGINLSLAYANCWDDPAVEAMNHLVSELNLGGPATPQGLWIRKRESEDRSIWFVFNVAAHSQRLELPSQPREVWEQTGCRQDDRIWTLGPGAAWVAEMSP